MIGQKFKCNNAAKVSDRQIVIENPIVIADQFNKHYVSIADKIAQEIPAVNQNRTRFVARVIILLFTFQPMKMKL